jgi:hypothetical protein
MPEPKLPSGSDVYAAMPWGFLKFWDVVTDGFKLMRDREDIKHAVSEAINAMDVAAHDAAQAAAVVAVAMDSAAAATAKLRAAKDLIVTATD